MANTPQDFLAVNPSTAPTARAEARLDKSAIAADRDARVVIATQLITSLTDWLGIVCLTYLIAMNALEGSQFGWGIVALASGSTIAKARQKAAGGSTTALVLAAGPLAWKAVAMALGRTVLGATLLLLVGCGQAPGVEDARAAIVTTGEGLERARSAILALCDERPPLPPLSGLARARCDDAIAGLNAAVTGYQVVRQVSP